MPARRFPFLPVGFHVEGIGDTPVGGVGLPVDAVSVGLQQAATPCPARRATSVAGTPEFNQSETAAWAQVVEAAAERRPALRQSDLRSA